MASTRERIMEVATDLFIEQGYERTSLREIAEQVGVTKAALYYHFASKEDLIRALLEPMSAMEMLFVDTTPDRPSLEEWADMLDRMMAWMVENSRTFQLLERNHDLFDSLHEEGHSHFLFHESLERIIGDTGRSVEDRILMAASVGQAFAIGGLGGDLLVEVEPDVLTKVLSASMRRTLGVS